MKHKTPWTNVWIRYAGVYGLAITWIVGIAWSIWVFDLVPVDVAIAAVSGLTIVGGTYWLEWRKYRLWQNYILSMSHRVERLSREVITELPLGILLYDEDKRIEWHNPWISQVMHRQTLLGVPLHELCPVTKWQKMEDTTFVLPCAPYPDKYVYVVHKVEHRLVYLFDVTEQILLQKKYENNRLVLGLLLIDNIDEVTQGMDDQLKSMTLAKVTAKINAYAQQHRLYFRRMSTERYLFLLNHEQLEMLQKNKFDLLDDIKSETANLKWPMTVSIGIAAGNDDFIALGATAQAALDLALGRGGDQAAVKIEDRITFYGGRSNAVEKRSKIRTRVFAHALRDLIRESDHVFVMGHRQPDMDSVGASVGIICVADALGVPASLVIEGPNASITSLLDVLEEHPQTQGRMISPLIGLERITPQSLVVIVDTHKVNLLAEPKFVQLGKKKIVIDHHRRSEDGIDDATLMYMEPYASSASELVAELLPYISDAIEIGNIEATALLAGIVTDTNSFSVRTGARTYEAAAYLRRNGADSSLIQHMLKDKLSDFLLKAEMIRNTTLLQQKYAVAVAPKGYSYTPLLCAQVADTLLDMQGIVASFVVSERGDGRVNVSARSLGELNVQVLMESYGGGGHLTHAAAQIEGSIDAVRTRVIQDLMRLSDSKETMPK